MNPSFIRSRETAPSIGGKLAEQSDDRGLVVVIEERLHIWLDDADHLTSSFRCSSLIFAFSVSNRPIVCDARTSSTINSTN